MLSREAGPDNVGEIHRDMIENSHTYPWIMGSRNTRHTRSQTGAQNSNARVPLLLEPVEARARVDDRLARGVDRPADVARHVIVGPPQFTWHPLRVICHRHAQRA